MDDIRWEVFEEESDIKHKRKIYTENRSCRAEMVGEALGENSVI